MSILKYLSTTILLLFLQTVAANQSWTPNVSKAQTAFEAATKHPLKVGHRIEPTIFPRFYAVRSGSAGAPAAYFREDFGWLGNIIKQGWAINSAAESSQEGRAAWLKSQVGSLPLDQLIYIKRGKPAAVVIWTAPDCAFCRKLEQTLEREDISAYVAPVGLSEAGYQESADIYCANDPAKSWNAAMHNVATDHTKKPNCVYPVDMMKDIGFFFGFGRLATPVVIFADGSTITGWEDERGLAVLREKIAQKLFYPAQKLKQ